MGIRLRLRSFSNRLLGRRIKISPKDLASSTIVLADLHCSSLLRTLAVQFSQGRDAEWLSIRTELHRAYFAMACVRVGQRISDESTLNRYFEAMLAALRSDSGPAADIIRQVYADEHAVAYCVRLYAHGQPSPEDYAAVLEVPSPTPLDFQHPFRMFCAYFQLRSLRILDAHWYDVPNLCWPAWRVNTDRFRRAWEFFQEMSPTP
jgi:hypothetical protein